MTGTRDDQLYNYLSIKDGFFHESASLVASFLPLWCSAEIPKLHVYVVGLRTKRASDKRLVFLQLRLISGVFQRLQLVESLQLTGTPSHFSDFCII